MTTRPAPPANPRRDYYLRDFRQGTPVCPYFHDHPGGEGYEDCVSAFEDERAKPPRTFKTPDGRTYDARPCESWTCRREHTLLPCGVALFDYHRVEEEG